MGLPTALTTAAMTAALLPQEIGPYIVLSVIGYGVGVLGHIMKSKPLIAVGILVVLIGTTGFLFASMGGAAGPSDPPSV